MSCKSLLERVHAEPEPVVAADGAKPPRAGECAAHENRDDHQEDIEHVRVTTR
jgi:hypothetical protein